jgi:hypothetical protein
LSAAKIAAAPSGPPATCSRSGLPRLGILDRVVLAHRSDEGGHVRAEAALELAGIGACALEHVVKRAARHDLVRIAREREHGRHLEHERRTLVVAQLAGMALAGELERGAGEGPAVGEGRLDPAEEDGGHVGRVFRRSEILERRTSANCGFSVPATRS